MLRFLGDVEESNSRVETGLNNTSPNPGFEKREGIVQLGVRCVSGVGALSNNAPRRPIFSGPLTLNPAQGIDSSYPTRHGSAFGDDDKFRERESEAPVVSGAILG